MANENSNPGHGGGNPGHGGGNDTKLIMIVVNGTEYEVPKERISYEELLALIEANALPEGQRYQVLYSRGHPRHN